MDNKISLQDLIDALAAKEGLTRKKAEAFVKALFETIEEGLLSDKFVKIKGLGTFKIIAIGERESVNINTGERFSIEGHERITFTPDTALKELVNRPFAHFQTVVLNDATDLEELEKVEDNAPMPEREPEEDTERTEELPKEIEDITSQNLPADKLQDADNQQDNAEAAVAETAMETAEEGPFSDETPEIPAEPIAAEVTADASNETQQTGEDMAEANARQESVEQETAATGTGLQPQKTELPEAVPTPLPGGENDNAAASATEQPRQARNDAEDGHTEETSSSTEEAPAATTGKNGLPEGPAERGKPHNEEEMQYIIQNLEHKSNTWRNISILSVFLLLLGLSYFAGYFRWFCPCEMLERQTEKAGVLPAAPATPKSIETGQLQPDPIAQKAKKDTIPPTHDSVRREILTPPSYRPQPAPEQPEKTGNAAKPATKSVQPAKPLPDTSETFSQVPGGRYRITGTMSRHRIRPGETIRQIAFNVYGSKGYAIYITTHNHIDNPDNITAGTVLKLPQLVKQD